MGFTNQQLAKAIEEKGLAKSTTVESLIKNAENSEVSLKKLLFKREIIPDEKLGAVVAELYEVPFVKVSEKIIPDSVLREVPYTLASHQSLIPFEKTNTELYIATSKPENYELINFLGKKTGLAIKIFYATRKDIKAALKFYNRDVNTKFSKLLKSVLADPSKIESLRDAAKILDTIILFAYQNNASDIHIEPHKEFLTIRYRVDGLLQTIAELPIQIAELLSTRTKVLANLPTDEHQAALDGRFKIELEDNEITLRVSIIPTYDGEKTVFRILSSANQDLNIESLGYSKRNLKLISENILKTHGMILTTGPTGSGKTTTMYSILKLLNSPEINISTIEDPIEYRLEGISQIQVNPKKNITFASGLRSLLRQDPDVLMVGEIRDEETAATAVNSALTGHLVLATLHTNDASSTLLRLGEMNVEPFLIAATVKLIIAQRLIRRICQKCKESYALNADQIVALGEKFNIKDKLNIFLQGVNNQNLTLYHGKGCSTCSNSGYRGRTTIAESLEVSDEIRKMILENASPKEIEDLAIHEGMVPIFYDGMQKVLNGDTTIEEVLRVMRS